MILPYSRTRTTIPLSPSYMYPNSNCLGKQTVKTAIIILTKFKKACLVFTPLCKLFLPIHPSMLKCILWLIRCLCVCYLFLLLCYVVFKKNTHLKCTLRYCVTRKNSVCNLSNCYFFFSFFFGGGGVKIFFKEQSYYLHVLCNINFHIKMYATM